MPAQYHGGGGPPSKGASPGREQSQLPSNLPPVKYFDSEGNLRPELVDDEAQQWGKILAKNLKPTQMRRFYNDVLSIKQRFLNQAALLSSEEQERIFREIIPEIRLLKAKAYYAHRRPNNVLPREMKEFIERHVNAINSAKAFLAFCRHFEAVVAFHYAFAESRS
jgi:CRISPR-associated protein Csm2